MPKNSSLHFALWQMLRKRAGTGLALPRNDSYTAWKSYLCSEIDVRTEMGYQCDI